MLNWHSHCFSRKRHPKPAYKSHHQLHSDIHTKPNIQGLCFRKSCLRLVDHTWMRTESNWRWSPCWRSICRVVVFEGEFVIQLGTAVLSSRTCNTNVLDSFFFFAAKLLNADLVRHVETKYLLYKQLIHKMCLAHKMFWIFLKYVFLYCFVFKLWPH